jgi:hypothetical protein
VLKLLTKPKVLMVAALVAVVGLAALYAAYRAKYPYGMSHCCILIMGGALKEYANDHNGQFPTGKATPEASLSLLNNSNYANADLLRGKTVPEKTVARILNSGGLLGPDTCGWHYVEGLRADDDARIAILWDKVGLGHDGERLKYGGHEVMFVDGQRRFVSGKDWEGFLKGQQDLLAARTAYPNRGRGILTAEFSLPGGYSQWQSSHDGAFTLYSKVLKDYKKQGYVYSTQTPLDSTNGYTVFRSGGALLPSALTWYRGDVPTNGVVEYTLTFPGFRSWPVVVEFTGGVPDAAQVLFDMSGG